MSAQQRETSSSAEPGLPTSEHTGSARWLVPAATLAVLANAFLRIRTTLGLDGFEWDHAEGLLKSDPGLLYYITRRIVDAGGGIPADFRADPRIEWPLPTDIPALEAVGQEFLVAWAQLALGADVPLHIVAVVVMSCVASLTAASVIGLAWELTRDARAAALAGVLYLICICNYRTIGFILIREDLSLPLFALHLWLLARAARLGTLASAGTATFALLASVATWHAMQFVATGELACLYAWFLWRDENPLRGRAALVVPAILFAGCLLVPVLLAKRTFAAPLACLVASAALAEGIPRLVPSLARHRRMLALGMLALGLLAGRAAGSGTDYSHVYALLGAKLRHLGVQPADPSALSFEARLLWHGPFESATLADLMQSLGPLAVTYGAGLALLLPLWRTRGAPASHALLGAFAAAAVASALLLERLGVLLGLLGPVVAVIWLGQLAKPTRRALVLGLCLTQSVLFFDALVDRQLPTWYVPAGLPAWRASVEFMRDHLDPSGAVASDFVSSTVVLAHTRNASVLQPKYETLRSRQRIERMLEAFYFEPPAQLHALLTRTLRARYFLVNVSALLWMRYTAGLAHDAVPAERSAAHAFLAAEPSRYRTVPGFALLHEARSGPVILRLYELRSETSVQPSGPITRSR